MWSRSSVVWIVEKNYGRFLYRRCAWWRYKSVAMDPLFLRRRRVLVLESLILFCIATFYFISVRTCSDSGFCSFTKYILSTVIPRAKRRQPKPSRTPLSRKRKSLEPAWMPWTISWALVCPRAREKRRNRHHPIHKATQRNATHSSCFSNERSCRPVDSFVHWFIRSIACVDWTKECDWDW